MHRFCIKTIVYVSSTTCSLLRAFTCWTTVCNRRVILCFPDCIRMFTIRASMTRCACNSYILLHYPLIPTDHCIQKYPVCAATWLGHDVEYEWDYIGSIPTTAIRVIQCIVSCFGDIAISTTCSTTHLPSNTLCFKAVCHNIPNAQPSELATQPWPESKHKQRFKFAPKLSTLCAKRDPSRCPVHIGFVVTTNISCWNVAMCMCERFFVW